MITIYYRTLCHRGWSTKTVGSTQQVRDWYTDSTLVTEFIAKDGGRKVAYNTPKPFYLTVLQWMF